VRQHFWLFFLRKVTKILTLTPGIAYAGMRTQALARVRLFGGVSALLYALDSRGTDDEDVRLLDFGPHPVSG
jgi:hypothetical protein